MTSVKAMKIAASIEAREYGIQERIALALESIAISLEQLSQEEEINFDTRGVL